MRYGSRILKPPPLRVPNFSLVSCWRSTKLSTSDLSAISQLDLMKRQCWPTMANPRTAEDFVCDDSYPDMHDVLVQLRGHGVVQAPSTAAMFYTGWTRAELGGAIAQGKYFIRTKDPDAEKTAWFGNSVSTMWGRAQIAHLKKRYNGEEGIFPFSLCVAQALAEQTRFPTAYLMIAHDRAPKEASVWLKTELPTLTQNQFVNEIYSADPYCSERRLIWSRAKGDPILPVLQSCAEFEGLHFDNPDRQIPYPTAFG